jgi:hypothetical protein
LKKEVAIAERKLQARNERIESLEQLLHEAQDNFTTQNHKFEQQLQLVRERLEQARIAKASSPTNGVVAGSFLQNRIAKPLRGGGGIDANVKGYSIFYPKVNLDLWPQYKKMDMLQRGQVGSLKESEILHIRSLAFREYIIHISILLLD